MTLVLLLVLIMFVGGMSAVLAWANYDSEEEAYIASLRAQVGMGIAEEETVTETASSIITVRTYYSNYTSKLESEADARMRQANLFYERGICW